MARTPSAQNPKPETETPAFDEAALNRRLAITSAPAWKPEPGSTLTAHLVSVRMGGQTSEYGAYPVLIFRSIPGRNFPSAYSTDGEHSYVAFHCFHTLVKKWLVENRPNPDDAPIITTHYVGRMQFGKTVETPEGIVYIPQDGKDDYQNYIMFYGDGSEDQETFDWSDVEVKEKK